MQQRQNIQFVCILRQDLQIFFSYLLVLNFVLSLWEVLQANFFNFTWEFTAVLPQKENAFQFSSVEPGTYTYVTPLHNQVTYGDHRSFIFGVYVEEKSLQHYPQVCVGHHVLHQGIYRNYMLSVVSL
jgi:hypothetical protein